MAELSHGPKRAKRPHAIKTGEVYPVGELVVGIDFGTSYSSVSVARRGRTEIIPIENELALPSLVAFPTAKTMLIGTEAREQWAAYVQRTISSSKRLMGLTPNSKDVERLTSGLAFPVFAGTDGFLCFRVDDQTYSIVDICAGILRRLREETSAYLGIDVRHAVLASPVGYGTLARQMLKAAARRAGLEVHALISEPTAAIMAHGFRGRYSGRVAIFDFGGGTLDFSIIDVTPDSYRVLAAGGDPALGGDDFDGKIADHLANQFEKQTGIDLRSRVVEWQALKLAAESAKCLLSKEASVDIQLDDLAHTAQGLQSLRCKLKRQDFVNLIGHLIHRALRVARNVMTQSNLNPDDIDRVVLTGGTSQIPALQHAVSDFFGRKVVIRDPHLAVARGAAICAAELAGDIPVRRLFCEVAGRSFGASLESGKVVPLFERNTPLPARAKCRFQASIAGQRLISLQVFEHATPRLDQSRPIGILSIGPLPRTEDKPLEIEATFRLDRDGLLEVNAEVAGQNYSENIETDISPV
jgi:molecular chaperone DnaK